MSKESLDKLRGWNKYGIDWDLSEDEIRKILDSNSVKHKYEILKISPRISLLDGKFDTHIGFDVPGFYNLQQYQRFKKDQRSEAKKSYDETVKYYRDLYGKESKMIRNEERNLLEHFWIGKFTQIHICFFYGDGELQVHWQKS